MLRGIVLLGVCVTTLVSLTACHGSFNPQTSKPSKRDQCIAIQRKMVFNDNFRQSNVSEWDRSTKRAGLMKSFTKMHCQHVLAKH
jgi:hypothetical protein